jgi:hypothetical protein
MRDLDIPALPTDGEALRQWVDNLAWNLPGSSWCHNGTHVTELSETTPDTLLLSHDLCSAIMKASMKHKDAHMQRNTRNLPTDDVMGVNGKALVTQGRGIELFQQRVKPCFTRGLGTELISNLNNYTSATQHSLESVPAATAVRSSTRTFSSPRDAISATLPGKHLSSTGSRMGPTTKSLPTG